MAVPALNDNEQLSRLMSKVQDLAVLPHVVFKVLEISTSNDSPAQEMEKAIIVDPGFSGKVLTLANSAHYALPRKVSSIKDAVMFLGFRAIRSMAMTVGVFEIFVGKTDKESLRRRQWWRHSVDAAVCSRWLAKRTGKLSPDDAYTTGLLHSIGKSLLDKYGDQDYSLVEQKMEQNALSDIVAETEVFGCHHVEVAISAAQRWNFPDELIAGLDYVNPVADDAQVLAARACTCLGSLIGAAMTQGADTDREGVLPKWAMDALGLSPEEIGTLYEEGMQAISEANLKF